MGEIRFLLLDVVYAGPEACNRKSKIGLRHAILPLFVKYTVSLVLSTLLNLVRRNLVGVAGGG